MNYDETEIADRFDRARTYPAEVLGLWIDRILRAVPREEVSELLDLGCGTGRFSFALADALDARAIAVDPSGKMLAKTRGIGAGIELARAAAEALPFPIRSFDIVFLSMVYHHLSDPSRAARECFRVLRPSGRVCLRNGTVDELESWAEPYFFPSYRELARRELPSRADLIRVFESAGFRHESQEVVVHPMAASWPELADKLAKRADSFLNRIPDADFEAGLAALRDRAARADPAEPVEISVDLFVFRRP